MAVVRVDPLVSVRQALKFSAQGFLDRTFDPGGTVGNSAPGLGTMVGGAVQLIRGQKVTGGMAFVGTLQTVTHCWLVLYRCTDNTQLAITADDAAIVGTAGKRTKDWTSAYTPASDETAWVCILQVGGTCASLARGNNGLAGLYVGTGSGVRQAVLQNGLTTPSSPIVPADSTFLPYMEVY